MSMEKPKVVYRSGWCVLWRGLVYPFGRVEDAAGAAGWAPNRNFNPFHGYTEEQAEELGFRRAGCNETIGPRGGQEGPLRGLQLGD